MWIFLVTMYPMHTHSCSRVSATTSKSPRRWLRRLAAPRRWMGAHIVGSRTGTLMIISCGMCISVEISIRTYFCFLVTCRIIPIRLDAEELNGRRWILKLSLKSLIDLSGNHIFDSRNLLTVAELKRIINLNPNLDGIVFIVVHIMVSILIDNWITDGQKKN